MYTAQPGLVNLQKPHADPAHNATRLMIGRVVAVHADTDQIDVALLGGGRINNIPILSPLAGRNVGSAGLPTVTAGLEGATATGQNDTYAVIGYLKGEAELPVALGFLGPKDSDLLNRPAGSTVRRDSGGQLHVAFGDGSEEHRYPGGALRVGPDHTLADLDTSILPPDGDGPAELYFENDAGASALINSLGEIRLLAPNGLFLNGAPLSGYTLPIASSTVLGGIKIGSPLQIDGAGVVTIPNASAGALGVIKIGSPLQIDGAGVVTIPVASSSVLGVVKVGASMAIDGAGVLDVRGLTIPGGVTITAPNASGQMVLGTGVAGQVPYFDQTYRITSSANLLWDNTAKKLTMTGDRLVVTSTSNVGMDLQIAGVTKWTVAAYQGNAVGNYDLTLWNAQRSVPSIFIDGDNDYVAISNVTAPLAPLHVAGVSTNSNVYDRGIAAFYTPGASTAGGGLSAYKSRGSVSTPAAVVNGDFLGCVSLGGHDGSAWRSTAAIQALVNGVVASNSIPTDLIFTTDSASNVFTERMRIKSDGSVGIGGVPNYFVEIQKTDATAVRTGAIGAEIAVTNNSTGGVRSAGVRFRAVDTSTTVRSAARIIGSFLAATYADSALVLQTVSGSEAFQDVMTLRGTSVGIGTIAPQSRLHVHDGANAVDSSSGKDITLARYWNTSTDTRASAIFHYYLSSATSDLLAFAVAGDGGTNSQPSQISQVKMVISAAGKVGIGTTAPTAKLDVIDGYIRARDGTNTAPTSGKGAEIVGTGSVAYFFGYNRDSPAFLQTQFDGNPVLINASSGGNIGLIGISTPSGAVHARKSGGQNLLWWTHDAVAGTEITIMSAAGYNNLGGAFVIFYAQSNTTATTSTGSTFSRGFPASSFGTTQFTVGSSTYDVRFYSTGAITIIRNSGSDTCRVSMLFVMQ